MSVNLWLEGKGEKGSFGRPVGTPGAPPDPPDPPGDDTYAATYGIRLAPGALEGTVSTVMLVPLDITDNQLRTSGNGGQSLDNGQDIRIETSGGTLIPYQRDSYNASTGQLTGWIRLPAGIGTAGLEMVLKIGASGGDDQSSDPALVWAGYQGAWEADGTARAGPTLTLESGVTTDTDYRDQMVFDGAGGLAYAADASFLQGHSAQCRMMIVVGDASMDNTERGFFGQGNLEGTGGNWSVSARNRSVAIGNPSTNVIFDGQRFTGGFASWSGPSGSANSASHIYHWNFASGETPECYIDGILSAAANSVTSSGTTVIDPGSFALGRAALDSDSVSWLGSIAAVHVRSWAYGEYEAALLARMLWWPVVEAGAFNPIQLDTGGGYPSAPSLPDLTPDPPDPPDPGEGEGTDIGTALRTVNVSNSSELADALAAAIPGDHIVLANGTYSGPGTWTRDGTLANPIVVRAANLLGASMPANAINPNGAYQTLYGIQFTTGQLSVGNTSEATFTNIWRCRFTGSGAATTSMLVRTYNSKDLDVAYCEWTNHAGRGIAINPTVGSRRVTIRRCWFKPQPVAPANATEAVQIGFGGSDGSNFIDAGCSVIENYFEGWTNDGETISIKCVNNLVKKNTLDGCRAISCRHGWGNRIEANWLDGCASGLTNFDGDFSPDWGNLFLGNRLVNCTDRMKIFAGTVEAQYNGAGSSYQRSNRTVLAGNTSNIPVTIGDRFSSGTWAYPARQTRIRQHSGTINTNVHTETDSQPAVAETLYTWETAAALTTSQVGVAGS